jgi:hypothetical protein
MTTDSIMAKLAKLKAHADSASDLGNAAEAASFMAKVRDLLVKHELSMSDIEYSSTLEADPVKKGSWVGETTTQRRRWSEDLAAVIARSFFCRILVARRSDSILFVGRASHRVMAEYLYVRLRDDVETSGKKEYKRLRSRLRRTGGDLSDSHEFKEAFRREYTKTISERLSEERRREKKEASSTGTSLIRLDQALVRVDDYLKEIGTTRAKGLRNRGSANDLGRDLGREYGKRANLNINGVNEGSTPKKLR